MVRILRARLSPANHPDLIFWMCFFVLNTLLFMPLYLLNREVATFLPLSISSVGDPVEAVKQLALWRNNLDVFRLSAEFLLLAAFWVYVPWLRQVPMRGVFRWFFGVFYVLVLGYYIYESIMLSLYQVEPVFYSHFSLAVDGLQVVARHLPVPLSLYVLAGTAFLVGLAIITGIICVLVGGIPVERLSRWSKIGLALITLSVVMVMVTQQDALASPKMVVSSFGYKLRQNIAASIGVYRHILAFDNAVAQHTYNYSGQNLLQKPNIYLIFVESYGSVLYKRPDYREAYIALLDQLEKQLQSGGWTMASALSESPTWGGGSWMSYTSTLFGLRIDTHPQYLSLLNRYQSDAYPDLGHYLKTQGYEYIRLSSLSGELDEEEQRQYQKFYGNDLWLRYDDLEYRGPQYGWGPSPPDQYVLNFAYDTVLSKIDKPFFLFFITQNSHYPWIPLPQLVDDWRTLNEQTDGEDIPLPDPIPHPVKRQNYFNGINYELSFLIDYILKTGDRNVIYVLIGDHQPQQVSRRSDSFDTPVHIISQDAALVEALLNYGFEPSLVVQNDTATIRHEGFYSLFVRVLLQQYGQGLKALPEYLPDGMVIGDHSLSIRQSGVGDLP